MKKKAAGILLGLLISLNLFSQSTEYKINELISAYAENGQFNVDLYKRNSENHKFSQEYEKALKKIKEIKL